MVGTPSSDASTLSLLVFLISSILVIVVATKPFRVSIPKTVWGFTFHFGYPPVLGVLVLLCAAAISWEDVGHSVTGDGVSPVTVVMLFMSFAFICASLDMTGLFEWMGLRITEVTSGSCVKVRLRLAWTLHSQTLTTASHHRCTLRTS